MKMKEARESALMRYALWLLVITIGLFLLREAKIILVPLSFALLISFMYHPLGLRVERKMGRFASIVLCMVLLVAFGFILAQILLNSLSRLYTQFHASREKIMALGLEMQHLLQQYFGFTPDMLARVTQQGYENLIGQSLPFLLDTVLLSGETIAMVAIIPILTALIIHNRELLVRSAMMLMPEGQADAMKATVAETTHTYSRFAKGMVVVYAVVALLNTVGFWAIGIPNAIYFGVLASILTFFPYVGIFIGGSAAVIVAWTTFESLWYPAGAIAVLTVVQYLEANVIFPLAVGRQLKVNSLATLVVIFLGGMVWGGAGMVLFPPMLGILKVMADRVQGLDVLAVLLGPNTRNSSPEASDRKDNNGGTNQGT